MRIARVTRRAERVWEDPLAREPTGRASQLKLKSGAPWQWRKGSRVRHQVFRRSIPTFNRSKSTVTSNFAPSRVRKGFTHFNDMHAVSVSLSTRPVLRGRARALWPAKSSRVIAHSRSQTSPIAGDRKLVFIDGEAGTTGLQVRDRLAERDDIEIISLTGDDRKNATRRAEFLNKADCAILCLPDDAAIEAVSLVTNDTTVIIDASTAHRVMDGWTYGFPELNAEQKQAVKSSKRIANPGCYPTGMIALCRPLVDAGILPKNTGLVVHAVSGFSGGGKQLMAIHHAGEAEPWGAYGFNLAHKHLPEMAAYSLVGRKPIFCPAVGSFEQGMVVSVPLHYDQLSDGASGAKIHEAIAARYANSRFVSVRPLNETADLERGAFLRPDTLNDTNELELSVYANDADGMAWLVSRLDNLGKGASGAAVQNLNLALGLDEDSGL